MFRMLLEIWAILMSFQTKIRNKILKTKWQILAELGPSNLWKGKPKSHELEYLAIEISKQKH
jgi:hypothetical protein